MDEFMAGFILGIVALGLLLATGMCAGTVQWSGEQSVCAYRCKEERELPAYLSRKTGTCYCLVEVDDE